MTPPDINPPTGGVGGINLSAEDVKKIIIDTQSNQLVGTDPVSVGMQIFSSLGDQATVSGDDLRAALTAAGIPLAGPLAVVMAAIQSVTKVGGLVSVTNREDVQAEIDGTQVRLKKTVSFAVAQGNTPALSNITGVAVHKVFWIDIHSVQLKQDQGKKIVSVATSAGTKDFAVA
jgi:hypothetical protein